MPTTPPFVGSCKAIAQSRGLCPFEEKIRPIALTARMAAPEADGVAMGSWRKDFSQKPGKDSAEVKLVGIPTGAAAMALMEHWEIATRMHNQQTEPRHINSILPALRMEMLLNCHSWAALRSEEHT